MDRAGTRPRAGAEAAPLGILAGGSGVPSEIAAAVAARGRGVHIVGIAGEAERDIDRYPHTWVNLGGIGAMIRAFRDNGCREIVIIGRVRRPNLASIRPDLGFWTSLPVLLRLLRGGDDAILRLVVRFFERHGLKVVGAHEAAPELIAPAGVLGSNTPDASDQAAICRCTQALAALGPFDAAQAAIAYDGGLIAVEGADGTDAMLGRLAAPNALMRHPLAASGARRCVLVKMPKPDQDRRIDLPAIGPETMRRASAAGLAGIAVMSGQTLFAERQHAIELADAAGLFVIGLEPVTAPRDTTMAEMPNGLAGLKTRAQRSPSAAHLDDARLGASVLAAIEPLWPQACAVVSRGYVLATEGPGGAMSAAGRAGRLKPWGTRFLRRRSGVLVMTDIACELGYDPAELVRRAHASNLAGIAIMHSPRDEAALAALRSEADRTGLFLLAPGDAR